MNSTLVKEDIEIESTLVEEDVEIEARQFKGELMKRIAFHSLTAVYL